MAAALFPAGLITTLWIGSIPEYATATLKRDNRLLRIKYPSSWSADVSDASQGHVILTPRPAPSLQTWINSYAFRFVNVLTPEDSIDVHWFVNQPRVDLAISIQNLGGITGNTVRYSNCQIGTVLCSDCPLSPKPEKYAWIYLETDKPTMANQIEVYGEATSQSRPITFHTMDEIVARLELVPEPPARPK